jgi:K+-transporting ATPase ATPase C chain
VGSSRFRAAVVLFGLLSLVTGIVYPLVVTGLAQAALPRQANGSLIEGDGHVLGSTLVGQPFDDPKYFWGRLSATSPAPYNAGASSGSNFGPMNKALADAVKARVHALRAADPENSAAIPVDLVTASGSGLDPHISPAAAAYQVSRVAGARGLSEARIGELVAQATEDRQFGLLGEPRVNVLLLNMTLDGVRGAR